MPDTPRFLLGYGERLTEPVDVDRGGQTQSPPYTFMQAVQRVTPMAKKTAEDLAAVPEAACPDDYAVGLITLHPQYTAKSFFPGQLLQAAGMEAIGSRPSRVKPEKMRRNLPPTEEETVQLFVSARRRDLVEWAEQLPSWTESDPGAKELFEIELFRAPSLSDRLQKIESKEAEPLLEVVLHTEAQLNSVRILEAFEAYAAGFGLKPDLDRRFEVGGLCFMPLRTPRNLIPRVSEFSFLRTAREMPRLRQLRPMLRAARKRPFACQLPDKPPLDPQLKAAVFDGGLPPATPLEPFAIPHETSGLKARVNDALDHGLAVTSALLFGPLRESTSLSQPYGVVDHFRVLDADSGQDPYELYDVLNRIRNELQNRRYSFVNLSIGPRLAIEDHDVHAWTAVLDDLLSTGETVLTVAVGNDGDKDWAAGLARVQVPSDLVNAIAIGASDTRGRVWRRSNYSCIGPGRSPGLIKPDALAFGGTEAEPFYVLDRSLSKAIATLGTSFASPFTLRQAMGIRAHFGSSLGPLAIKALLIHCAEEHKTLEKREVGWGRIPEDLDDFVVCRDATVRVVYQGELTAGQFLRTPIPLPAKLPNSRVTIRATFCIASATDPQDPSNYTRSGLDIVFRPHMDMRKRGGVHADTTSFFRQTDFETEKSLRHNAHKWETVLHACRTKKSSSLKDPVFDVHYQTRVAGKPVRGGGKIKFALIVTVTVPRMHDLYDKVVQRYRTQLEPLRPVIQLPVRI